MRPGVSSQASGISVLETFLTSTLTSAVRDLIPGNKAGFARVAQDNSDATRLGAAVVTR